jgi:hypothetical protein
VSKKTEKKSARSQSNPVTLRLGDLEDEVAARASGGLTQGAVVRRDLERYYQLLHHAPMPFTAPEALVVAWLLGRDFERSGRRDFDPSGSGYRYIWAHIDEALTRFAQIERREPELLGLLLGLINKEELVSKLKALEPHQAMRVVDAAERFWSGGYKSFLDVSSIGQPDWPVTNEVVQNLSAVGLLDSFEGFTYRFFREYRKKHGSDQGGPPSDGDSTLPNAGSRPEGGSRTPDGSGRTIDRGDAPKETKPKAAESRSES